MDQSTLVGGMLDDGRRFVERFAADGWPVQAAFWARMDDEEYWFLYLATELVDRVGPTATYSAVHDSLEKLDDPGLSGFVFKVVSPNSPVAKQVLAAMANHPKQIQANSRGFAPMSLAFGTAYIYPPRFFTVAQANPMTSEEVGVEIVRLLSRRASSLSPSRVLLKDGTSFHGVPFALERGGQQAVEARFIAKGEASPRVVPLEEIASIA